MRLKGQLGLRVALAFRESFGRQVQGFRIEGGGGEFRLWLL